MSPSESETGSDDLHEILADIADDVAEAHQVLDALLSERPHGNTFGDWDVPEDAVPFHLLPKHARFMLFNQDGNGDGVVWVKGSRYSALREDQVGDPLDFEDWLLVRALPDLNEDSVVEVEP